MMVEKVCLRSVLKSLHLPSDNVVAIRPPPPEIGEARLNVLRAAVTLCELECGGCELSRQWKDTGII